MKNKVNVLAFVHGMTTDVAPSDPRKSGGTYDKFWKALQAHKPELASLFSDGPILVEWGHQLSSTENPVREDHRITEVERFVNEQVSYRNLKNRPGPNNVTMSGLHSDWGIPGIRQVVTNVREGVVSFGLTDVVYYCSGDGEIYVRAQVYNQVLVAMQPYVAEPNVCIHLFGHSLGVTIVHDFLFGLFKKGHVSDFVEKYQGGVWASEEFKKWQRKAENGELTLGGLACAASQLPLMVMRKQLMIDKLFAHQGLDPADVGVVSTGIQWKFFYDIDDVLGFSSRNLYSPNHSIMDIQVNSGDLPLSAHVGYWENEVVIRETAQLFYDYAH
jgi:hypothetical protein